jgi:hypothetical protein
MHSAYPEYQLKGTWFVTCQRYLEERHGVPALADVVERMRPEFQQALREPLASEWYPEEASLDMLNGMLEHLCGGSRARYAEMMQESTAFGIGRFFRAIVRLSSVGFVLKQAPTFWRQLRRGPGQMVVEPEGHVYLVRYLRFPFLRHDAYRHCFPAQLAALAGATGAQADVRVLNEDDESIAIEVRPV